MEKIDLEVLDFIEHYESTLLIYDLWERNKELLSEKGLTELGNMKTWLAENLEYYFELTNFI